MVDHDVPFEQRIDTAEWNVAIHEAGHAMLADALGIEIIKVSIEGVRNKCLDRDGFCQIPQEVGRCESLVIALAGRAVDEKLNPNVIQNSVWLAYKTDNEQASEYLKKNCSDAERTNFNRLVYSLCSGWVAEWVTRYKGPIVAFANRLMAAKSLSGDNLRSSLADSWCWQNLRKIVYLPRFSGS